MERKGCRFLRQLRLWAAVTLAVAGVSVSARVAAASLSGVRSTSPAIRELIDDAMWESPTFRGIARAIGATDGIVYVEQGFCGHSVHSCLVLEVTPAAGYRILHIHLDLQGVLAHRGRSDLMATIGHEISHALEVLSEPAIRSAAAMFLFYVRKSPTSNPTFETAAAIAAAAKIRSELGNHVTFVFQQVALDVR